MNRVALTKREARTVAKEIAASWIRTNVTAGNVAGSIERRSPDEDLATGMKLVRRVEAALRELADKMDPEEKE